MLFPEDVWIVIRDLKRHKPLRVALDAILARTKASKHWGIEVYKFLSSDHMWRIWYIHGSAHEFSHVGYYWRGSRSWTGPTWWVT